MCGFSIYAFTTALESIGFMPRPKARPYAGQQNDLFLPQKRGKKDRMILG
jgi:hypothetical protein